MIKIEEAIESIQGIRKINSVAAEGFGRVIVEVEDSYDIGEFMDDLKIAIDGISTFPAETERPTISKQHFRQGVLNVQVHGNLDERAMKELTDRIREEIIALPEVSYAEVMGARPFEISVEISEDTWDS